MMHFGENKQYKHKSQHRSAPGTDMFCGCRHGQCDGILKKTKQNMSLRIVHGDELYAMHDRRSDVSAD